MGRQCIRVAVTGAAGQIGYALLFRLASGAVFGPDVELELHLLEVTPVLPALQGVVMELEDCAFPLVKKIVATDDIRRGFEGVNWAILVGAAARKQGMERSDLLQVNAGIFREQGAAIGQYAADDVRVFVVGNPCNTNAWITQQHAPNVPSDRFFAMTALDENRGRAQLAIKAGVPITAVENLIIWGNHSATQFPDYYHAKIGGKPVPEVITDSKWLQEGYLPMVQQRGAAVIKARGASSAASAANGVVDGIRALTGQLPANAVFSMGICSAGQYGAERGLVVSYPCRCLANGKLEVVTDITHNAHALQLIQASLAELVEECHAVRASE